MPVVRCEAQVAWAAFRDPDSGRWVGVCHDLNLTVEGSTWADLQIEANEALLLLLRDLFETGELDQFLTAHHWRCEPPPHGTAPGDVIFDVPATITPTTAPTRPAFHA